MNQSDLGFGGGVETVTLSKQMVHSDRMSIELLGRLSQIVNAV